MTVLSTVTVPPTFELILTNRAELERWDVFNKKFYSVLFLSIQGAVNSFLVHVTGRPDLSQQPDGQPTWKTMAENASIRQCSGGVF